MASTSPLHADSLIEAALFIRNRGPQVLPSGHQQAMAKRLAQLNTAMGTNDAVANVHVATAPTRPEKTARRGLSTCLLTALVSALLGASATWLMTTPATVPPAAHSPQNQLAMPVGDRLETGSVTLAASATPQVAPLATATPLQDETLVEEKIETWRQAWTRHDTEAYLATYSDRFAPADGSSRADWAMARRKKLGGKAAIDIAINDLALERLGPDQFQVRFRQDYASGSYREVGRGKTLLLTREQGDWKILREQQD
ncbi:MAG: nuclear transport factor 2 family protein [Rhodocyclales bacterium GT-UBC]|nr:MAG: nuclear transport factor 2 family protein [Rhodocyclales bacterium GT-UBC]